jgi:hypothetical protein
MKKPTLGQTAVANWPEDEARQCVRRYRALQEDCGQEEALSLLRKGMRDVVLIFDRESERLRYWNAVLAEVPEAG